MYLFLHKVFIDGPTLGVHVLSVLLSPEGTSSCWLCLVSRLMGQCRSQHPVVLFVHDQRYDSLASNMGISCLRIGNWGQLLRASSRKIRPFHTIGLSIFFFWNLLVTFSDPITLAVCIPAKPAACRKRCRFYPCPHLPQLWWLLYELVVKPRKILTPLIFIFSSSEFFNGVFSQGFPFSKSKAFTFKYLQDHHEYLAKWKTVFLCIILLLQGMQHSQLLPSWCQ